MNDGAQPDPDADGAKQAPVIPILDGASPDASGIPPELEAERRIAVDHTANIEDRLEAFENVIDSEVGDTHLSRARNIEREQSLRQIYLKFDGGNPTGTQKDRIAFAQAMDALRRGFDTVTAATCGNYGAAVALAASFAGIRCVIFIPSGYRSRRLDEMRSYGAEIVTVDGDYEASVVASRQRAEHDELYDANPGGANTPIQMRAYGEIANEIYDELQGCPDGGGCARFQRHHAGRYLPWISEPLSARQNLPNSSYGCRVLLPEKPHRPVVPEECTRVRGPRSGGHP